MKWFDLLKILKLRLSNTEMQCLRWEIKFYPPSAAAVSFFVDNWFFSFFSNQFLIIQVLIFQSVERLNCLSWVSSKNPVGWASFLESPACHHKIYREWWIIFYSKGVFELNWTWIIEIQLKPNCWTRMRLSKAEVVQIKWVEISFDCRVVRNRLDSVEFGYFAISLT